MLVAGKLAWQGLNGNVVLLAEVPPENEPLVELSGLIRDYVIDRWFLLSRHNRPQRSVAIFR